MLIKALLWDETVKITPFELLFLWYVVGLSRKNDDLVLISYL